MYRIAILTLLAISGNPINLQNSGSVAKLQSLTASSVSGSHTPNITNFQKFYTILDQNLTVNNPAGTYPTGQTILFTFIQDATGGRTVAWGTAFKGVLNFAAKQGPTKKSWAQFTVNGDNTFTLVDSGATDLSKPLNVEDWGAIGDGTTDCTTPINNAVAFAIARNTQSQPVWEVHFPAGIWATSAEIMIHAAVKFTGAGRDLTTLKPLTNNAINGFVAYPYADPALMPLTTSLVTGPGQALSFSSATWTGSASKELNFSEWFPFSLTGLTSWNVRFWYKDSDASDTSNDNDLFFYAPNVTLSGANGPSLAATGYLKIKRGYSGGTPRIWIDGNWDSGASGQHGSNLSNIPDTSAHNYEINWDGTNLQTFRDGVQQTTYAQGGTFVMSPSAKAVLGTPALGVIGGGGAGSVHGSVATGVIDSFQISNVSRHTSNFTAPTAKYAKDANTLVLLNFDSVTANQIYVENGTILSGSQRWLLMLEGASSYASGPFSGVPLNGTSITDLGMSNYLNAIWTSATSVARYERLTLSARHLIHLTNQGFSSQIRDVSGSPSSTNALAGIAIAKGAGDYVLNRVYITHAAFADLYIDSTDNVRINDSYLQQAPYNAVVLGSNRVSITDTYFSMEGGGGTPVANLWIFGNSSTGEGLAVRGGNFDTEANDIPGVMVDGKVDLVLTASAFTASHASSFVAYGPTSNAALHKTVKIMGYSPFADPPVSPLLPSPITAGDSFLVMGTGVYGLTGISSTSTQSNNLAGKVTISNTDTSAAVTFGTAEADSKYKISLSAGVDAGNPTSGSLQPYWTSKATTGFTINLVAAPDAGCSVDVDWELAR